MTTCRAGFLPLLLLLLTIGACSSAPQPGFDRGGLEEREDLSESLANDLLAFSVSVRERDYEAVAEFVAEAVATGGLPATVPPEEQGVKWIRRRGWSVPDAVGTLSRAEFLEQLEQFVSRFTEIDDVRFKVKHAEFESERAGAASLEYFLVGREASGRREWLKGTVRASVRREADERWAFDAFRLETLQSTLCNVDLFSEVSFPAGVTAIFPAFGVGNNRGFVSHGAAVADVDGDGLLDLAATGVDRNYLYVNEGDGTFRDAGAESLVEFRPKGSGALFLDYDNDGDADLFFAAVGQQILLENRRIPDGMLQFWDVSEKAGVDRFAVGFSAVAGDVNRDGLPDIYVCSYNKYGDVMPESWVRATNGTPNLLFVNQGDGTFREEAARRGLADPRWSYAASFVDLDLDSDLDLYVANDFGENALYLNDGGSFTDVADRAGLTDPGFGMGVSFADYDNDGDLDLHVTNMSSTAGNRILELLYPEHHEIRRALSKQAAGNSLYRNNSDGTFTDVTAAAGGLSGGWAFGGGFVDFDNDGWEDLYTPNGFVSGKTMRDT